MSLWHPKRQFKPLPHAYRHEYLGDDLVTDLDRLLIRGTEVIDGDRNLKNIASGSIEGDLYVGGNLIAAAYAPTPVNYLPINLNEYIWYHWLGDSIDGFEVTPLHGGSVTLTTDGIVLETGTTAGGGAEITRGKINVENYITKASWLRPRQIRICADIPIGEGTEAHIGTGRVEHIGAQFIEFSFFNGEITGCAGDGVGVSSVHLAYYPSDIDISLSHSYTIVFEPGEKADFYIDGELKGTVTTNLPSGYVDASYMFSASIYSAPTDVNLPYSVVIYEILFIQYPYKVTPISPSPPPPPIELTTTGVMRIEVSL